MARTATLVTAVLAVLALGACGSDDGSGGNGGGGGGSSAAERPAPTAQAEPREVVAAYLAGFRNRDFAAVCAALAPRGRGVLASFLPSKSRSRSCEEVAAQVARNTVPLKRVKVGDADVSGASATVEVRSTDPPFASGVLLAKGEDGWRISYPPGFIAKLKGPPGVREEEPGHQD